MKKIIPLSSLVTMREVAPEWVKLYQYADNDMHCCRSALPSVVTDIFSGMNTFFQSFSRLKSVQHFLNLHENGVFHRFNMGKMSVDEFTDFLMKQFSFLEKSSKLNGKTSATNLLKKVFCSHIFFTEQNFLNWEYLLSLKENVIIVADTNPIHVNFILNTMSYNYNKLKWNIDSQSILKAVTHNVSLATSYEYNSHVLQYDNNRFSIQNSSILSDLIDEFGAENLEIVYDDPKLAEEATLYGVMTKTSQQFYPKALAHEENLRYNV